MVSKFIERGADKENVWEHGNIGQFWKETRIPWETLRKRHPRMSLIPFNMLSKEYDPRLTKPTKIP